MTAISRHTFRDAGRHFNSAARGLESVDAAGSIQEGLDWDEAVAQVRIQFAQLLGARETEVTVFHNTTAAVQRILLVLNRYLRDALGTLFLNDAEYPGIVAAAHDYWQGRLAMARIADYLWRGDSVAAKHALWQAYLVSRPSVVYLSHVTRAAGYEIQPELLRAMRGINPRVVIVLDGAQAAGNVAVGVDLLREVDFYVTSGHKWLCGRTALGLVYARSVWDLTDQAQGYSSRSGSAGTGDIGVLQSVAKALADFNGSTTGSGAAQDSLLRMKAVAEHNRARAARFSSEIKARGLNLRVIGHDPPDPAALEAQGDWKGNGIIAVQDRSQAVPWSRLRARRRLHPEYSFTIIRSEPYLERIVSHTAAPRFSVLTRTSGRTTSIAVRRLHLDRSSAPTPIGTLARFSFHYHHSDDDVDALIQAIDDERANRGPRRPRRAGGGPST